jgi:hypothetical protein
MATEEPIPGKEYTFYDKTMIQTIQVRSEYICFTGIPILRQNFVDQIQSQINAKPSRQAKDWKLNISSSRLYGDLSNFK